MGATFLVWLILAQDDPSQVWITVTGRLDLTYVYRDRRINEASAWTPGPVKAEASDVTEGRFTLTKRLAARRVSNSRGEMRAVDCARRTTASTSASRASGSRNGPAGRSQPLPQPRLASTPQISTSRASA